MSLANALRHIDELAALSNRVDSFSVYLSGGEPFLRYEDLLTVVHYAKAKGADQLSCVTNGFWGEDAAKARQWARELHDAGVDEVCFSLDDFHQEYVPLKSALAALAACREVGLCFAIKSTVTRVTRRLPQILSELGSLLLDTYVPVQELAYVPQLSEGDRIPEDEWLVQQGIPNEPCPELKVLAILPNGTTFPCCGSGWTQRLVVGNALLEPVADLVGKVMNKSLFALLRDKGPAHFLPYFTQAGFPLSDRPYVNRCHLCRTILDHPQIEQIIWWNGLDNYVRSST